VSFSALSWRPWQQRWGGRGRGLRDGMVWYGVGGGSQSGGLRLCGLSFDISAGDDSFSTTQQPALLNGQSKLHPA